MQRNSVRGLDLNAVAESISRNSAWFFPARCSGWKLWMRCSASRRRSHEDAQPNCANCTKKTTRPGRSTGHVGTAASAVRRAQRGVKTRPATLAQSPLSRYHHCIALSRRFQHGDQKTEVQTQLQRQPSAQTAAACGPGLRPGQVERSSTAAELRPAHLHHPRLSPGESRLHRPPAIETDKHGAEQSATKSKATSTRPSRPSANRSISTRSNASRFIAGCC